MTLEEIERWWIVETPDGGPARAIADNRVKHYQTADAREQGYRVEGPFVHADAYDRAVEEREAMYEALVAQLGSHKLAEIAFRRRLDAKRGR